MAEKYKDQPNFRGVCWTCYLTGEWLSGFGGMNWRTPGDTLFYSYEDATIRQFVRVYRVLPGSPFQPALGTALKSNLAIAELREGGAYYLRVANPGCWSAGPR